MKPVFFQTQDELGHFIRNLPEPSGSTIHGTASEVKAKLLALVPSMFTLRATLAKEQGGLGNYKSLYRFSELATENIDVEAMAELEATRARIELESTELYNSGLEVDACLQVADAKSLVAQFQYMKSSIKGFQARLEELLNRVIVVQTSMNETVEKVSGLMKGLVRKGQANATDVANIQRIKEDSDDKAARTSQLAASLNEYGDLMVAFNGMFLSNHN